MAAHPTMKIGHLSKQAGCKPETIRFYEQQRVLLPPRRTHCGYRDYDQEHLQELLFVRDCRALGLTLAETRELLQLRRAPEQGCDNANRLLDRRLKEVREQIRSLRRLTALLQRLRAQCVRSAQSRNCGILQSLGAGKKHAPIRSASAASGARAAPRRRTAPGQTP